MNLKKGGFLMIYVPDIEHFECFSMQDGYIRGYEGINNLPASVSYTDFLYNSNYYTRTGQEFLSEYPSCIDSSKLTTDFYYRTDIDKILVLFLIFSFVIIYLPIKTIFHLLNRRRRV